ncbi:MAG: LpxI family protein [Dissulfurimicrobium sp.]|uniref:LpxI family protein n=1 Tax=Dissulfurimicrobium sp. TaxID=2022436 RepID=UPI00404A6BFA
MEGGVVGLIAGGGQFPILCARAARLKGRKVIAIAHKGETLPELGNDVDAIEWISIGQLGRLIKILKDAGVSEAIFVGTITKKRIFIDVRPDLRALNLWRRLDKRLDDSILRAIAAEIESEGIKVLPSTFFMHDILMPDGVLTRKKPSASQVEDIEFGLRLAKKIGALDIGQCVVVKDKVILAVEAIEGTDETILRGGRLGGPGAVVVKICKPFQDTRFDLPSVGLGTIERMAEVGAEVLAVESGRALLFDRDQAVALADRSKIAIVGIDGGIGI